MREASTVPPFRPHRLARELAIDRVLATAILVTMLLSVWWSLSPGRNGAWATGAFLLVLFIWMGLGMRSARVAAALAGMETLIHGRPAEAEARLAAGIRHRFLARRVRLQLYHHLALLRLRQARFGEAAQVAEAVLAAGAMDLRAARAHLLLVSAEARLACGDAWGTWGALVALGGHRLALPQLLQALLLHLRYHAAIGRDAAMLDRIERKVPLLELLPPPVAAGGHELLAGAAARHGAPGLADWLAARARLLSEAPVVDPAATGPGAPPAPTVPGVGPGAPMKGG